MTVDRSVAEIFNQARRADVEAVAGVKLWRAGRRLRGECPLCGGSSGKRADGCFSADPRSGLWKCWKCDAGGDVIELEHRLRGLPGEMPLDAAKRLIGEERRAPLNPPVRQELEEANDFSARVADELWKYARPAAGTIVEAYLRQRGLADWVIAQAVRFLRFHPAAYHSGSFAAGARFPAMIGRLRTPEGPTDGIHVTYLAPGGAGKAKIAPAKKMWGPQSLNGVRGGVWLAGTTGKGPLVVGEGIETTLAAGQLVAGQPCRMVAALSLGGLQGGALADRFGRYSPDVITADPDRPAFTWPEPEKRPWGEVLIAVDRDMSPVPMKVRKLGGGTAEVQVDSDARARICAGLAIQAWKSARAPVVRAIAPGAGRDFIDELRERLA